MKGGGSQRELVFHAEGQPLRVWGLEVSSGKRYFSFILLAKNFNALIDSGLVGRKVFFIHHIRPDVSDKCFLLVILKHCAVKFVASE